MNKTRQVAKMTTQDVKLMLETRVLCDDALYSKTPVDMKFSKFFNKCNKTPIWCKILLLLIKNKHGKFLIKYITGKIGEHIEVDAQKQVIEIILSNTQFFPGAYVYIASIMSSAPLTCIIYHTTIANIQSINQIITKYVKRCVLNNTYELFRKLASIDTPPGSSLFLSMMQYMNHMKH